jgi:hypothetical protein
MNERWQPAVSGRPGRMAHGLLMARGGEIPTADPWDGTIVSGRRGWHRE